MIEGLPLGRRPQDGESRLGDVVSRLEVERIDCEGGCRLLAVAAG